MVFMKKFLAKLNPIYKKELLLESRSLKLPALILVYNIFLAIIGMVYFYAAFDTSAAYDVGYRQMIDIYSKMLEIEFIIILFAVPAYSACMVSREYEKNTMGVILTTRMPLIKIIAGKLYAVVTTVAVLVMSSLPVIAITFCVGGINIFDLLQYVLLIIVTTFFLGSIGILFSTILMKTTVAVFASYISLLVLTLGTYGIMSLIYSNVESSSGTGFFSVILLINPIFSMLKLVSNQTASSDTFDNVVSSVCQSTFLVDHWLIISMIIQLMFTFGVVVATVWISRTRHSGIPLRKKMY